MGFLELLLAKVGVLAQWSEDSQYIEDVEIREEGKIKEIIRVAKIQGLEGIISSVLGIIVPIVGVLLLMMLIAGGFQYITSGGEVEQANKAKKTLTYAIFGLIVVLGAWLIIRLLEELTGLNLTTFTIPR